MQTVTRTSIMATIRWGSVILGLLFAAAHADQSTYIYGAALLAHALWRTARPSTSAFAKVVVPDVIEVALTLTAVAATGWIDSPFVVTLVAPIVNALQTRAALRQADLQQSLAMNRLSQLGEANSLLSELHRVAQTLPVSLDLAELVTSTVGRLRELFEPNVVAVFLHDEVSLSWSVAATVGTRLPRVLSTAELPAPLQHAAQSETAHLVEDLRAHGPGLAATSNAGMYVALRARNRLVGMLAIERVLPGMLTERESALLEGMADQIAMALDNARWFGRLRRMGADEERTRIARDLHDRIGQGLAYLSFELDRISSQATPEVKADMQTLRGDVRQILGEVRETLSDLRTDVSDHQDLVNTMQSFIKRVERRTGLNIAFEHDGQQAAGVTGRARALAHRSGSAGQRRAPLGCLGGPRPVELLGRRGRCLK